MVLGIGEGKIEIVTEKQSYSAGEKVRGKVKLSLNRPKKAKGLKLRFYGIKEMGGRGGMIEDAYVAEARICGEQEFPAGQTEYGFELQLPSKEQTAVEGTVLPLQGVNLPGNPWANVQWNIEVWLDLPLFSGIKGKTQINFMP